MSRRSQLWELRKQLVCLQAQVYRTEIREQLFEMKQPLRLAPRFPMVMLRQVLGLLERGHGRLARYSRWLQWLLRLLPLWTLLRR